MRILIDRDTCMSAGQCVMTAPGVFEEDDEGLSTVAPGHERDGHDALVREAATACPVQAITITDDHQEFQ